MFQLERRTEQKCQLTSTSSGAFDDFNLYPQKDHLHIPKLWRLLVRNRADIFDL